MSKCRPRANRLILALQTHVPVKQLPGNCPFRIQPPGILPPHRHYLGRVQWSQHPSMCITFKASGSSHRPLGTGSQGLQTAPSGSLRTQGSLGCIPRLRPKASQVSGEPQGLAHTAHSLCLHYNSSRNPMILPYRRSPPQERPTLHPYPNIACPCWAGRRSPGRHQVRSHPWSLGLAAMLWKVALAWPVLSRPPSIGPQGRDPDQMQILGPGLSSTPVPYS